MIQFTYQGNIVRQPRTTDGHRDSQGSDPPIAGVRRPTDRSAIHKESVQQDLYARSKLYPSQHVYSAMRY